MYDLIGYWSIATLVLLLMGTSLVFCGAGLIDIAIVWTTRGRGEFKPFTKFIEKVDSGKGSFCTISALSLVLSGIYTICCGVLLLLFNSAKGPDGFIPPTTYYELYVRTVDCWSSGIGWHLGALIVWIGGITGALILLRKGGDIYYGMIDILTKK